MHTTNTRNGSKTMKLAQKLFVILFCAITFALHNVQGILTRQRQILAKKAYKILKYYLRPIFAFLGFSPSAILQEIFWEVELTWIGRVAFSLFCSFAYISMTCLLILALTLERLVTNELLPILEVDMEKVIPSQVR